MYQYMTMLQTCSNSIQYGYGEPFYPLKQWCLLFYYFPYFYDSSDNQEAVPYLLIKKWNFKYDFFINCYLIEGMSFDKLNKIFIAIF